MQIETAEDAAEAYKSFDGWQYADREATWKWMFEYGRIAGVAEREREIERLHLCRIELVNALHTLASNYENALHAFGEDAEARNKAKGDIGFAMHVAAKHNQNGIAGQKEGL